MPGDTLPPFHPGEVLREQLMVPLGLTAGRIAEARGMPRTCIERIATERLGLGGETAVGPAEVSGTAPEVRMDPQATLPEMHRAA